MTDKFTPPPPVEQSLKYLAWSIKGLDENVKRITECLEKYLGGSTNVNPKSSSYASNSTKPYKDDEEIPF